MKIQLVEFTGEKSLLRGVLFGDGQSENLVIMMAGFERNCHEPKFRKLTQPLLSAGWSVLRFDFDGCGLSAGDFRYSTIDLMTADLRVVVSDIKQNYGYHKIALLGHSIAGCAIVDYLQNESVEKAVLLAPALNQKQLLRYWFVKTKMVRSKPDLLIKWDNFNDYLDESEFREYTLADGKMRKANYIDADYFVQAMVRDYNQELTKLDQNNILVVHGDCDEAVPIISNQPAKNLVVVAGGDHDLERPDMYEQWQNQVVNFLGVTNG